MLGQSNAPDADRTLQLYTSVVFVPMAPSESAQGGTVPSGQDKNEKEVPNDEQKVASVAEEILATNGTKSTIKSKQGDQAGDGPRKLRKEQRRNRNNKVNQRST